MSHLQPENNSLYIYRAIQHANIVSSLSILQRFVSAFLKINYFLVFRCEGWSQAQYMCLIQYLRNTSSFSMRSFKWMHWIWIPHFANAKKIPLLLNKVVQYPCILGVSIHFMWNVFLHLQGQIYMYALNHIAHNSISFCHRITPRSSELSPVRFLCIPVVKDHHQSWGIHKTYPRWPNRWFQPIHRSHDPMFHHMWTVHRKKINTACHPGLGGHNWNRYTLCRASFP